LLGGAATVTRRLGIQRATTPFDDVERAPLRGYVYDSVVVVNPRETLVLELLAEQCQFQVSSLVYTKLEVLAIDPLARAIAFRITYDPNCGFRSFLPGIPES
jgi:hypothetical protein